MGAIVMENKEMDRIKCTVAYDGMHFCGYQIQPQHRTVQQEIEKALQKLHKGNLSVFRHRAEQILLFMLKDK